MATDLDRLLERRRLKRRLSLWRAGAIVALILLVLVMADTPTAPGPFVARINIDGVIAETGEQLELLEEIENNGRAKALIVRIDSPGGTTAGSEALYSAIRDVAAKKPVVATIETVGASGGYIVALASDRIIARQTSITGSIGVIFAAPEISGLLDKLGIDVETVKSAPLKGEPSGYEPMSEEARAAIRATIEDSYEWFIGLVAERRPFDADRARTLGDGRVYTGRQAVERELIDALGGQDEARAWLASEHNVAESLPTLDVDTDPADIFLQRLALRIFGKSVVTKRLGLDGLVSVWQPD